MANHTVLIIDYEPRSIRASTIPLEKHGFVVEVAHDGIAGLKAFDKLKPALVLIEAMLPKKHGFEVCQEIKKSAQGKATPVVITTGVYRGRKYRTQALHIYGCDEYLEKPFTEEQLLETCRRFLGGALPGPSRSEHEPSVAPTAGPAPAAKKEAGAEQPKIDDHAQRATGTDGRAATRGSGFDAVEGDPTEQEITARLDAMLSQRVEKASTAAIAVEPTPAAPSIGMAEELVSNDALDLGEFDGPETPHPFEGPAEPSADLDNVTAEELAGILEPLEPQPPETPAEEAPSADSRIVAFDSHREKRRRSRKRSKKPRREASRGTAHPEPPSADRVTYAEPPAEIRAEPAAPHERTFAEPAAKMETLGGDLGAGATGVVPPEEAAPASTFVSDVDSPPNTSLKPPPALPAALVPESFAPPKDIDARAGKTPLWVGIAAVLVCGVGAVLFFALRGGREPVRSAAPQVESTAGLGAARPTTHYEERDSGGSEMGRPEFEPPPRRPAPQDSSAGAQQPVVAGSEAARPRPVAASSDAQPPGTPTRPATPDRLPVDTPVEPKPSATVDTRAAADDGARDDSVEGGSSATDATPSVQEPVPSSTASGPDALPDPTGAGAEPEATSTEPPTQDAAGPEEAPPEPIAAPPATARGDLVDLRDADLAPTIVTRTPPDYPVVARRLRQEGTVVLNLLVNEDGNVVEVEVIRSVSDELDAAAERAAKSWAYRPAEKDGVAVSVWKPEKVTFKL